MPNLPVFPDDFDGSRIRNIPVFTGEGLRTRRVSILTYVPVQSTIPAQFQGFAPLAAVQLDPDSIRAFIRDMNCTPYYSAGILNGDPRGLFDNDTMSRFSVALSAVRPYLQPAGSPVMPGTNALMPTIEFQFRASVMNSPGDPRWWGILNNTGTLTYDGGNGFLGLTQEGILATRWEVWGRVRDSSNENLGPVGVTIQMSVDRAPSGPNVYGTAVTPVIIPVEAPIPPPP